jgi:stage II sporulation protein D
MRIRHSCLLLAATLTAASLTLVDGVATATSKSPAAERISVPDHATLTIRGRGYGHGHGMSQYGAEGAARQGLSAQRIVRFYYPHTRAGTVGGSVRVWISADTDHSTTVVARPGLVVRDLAGGAARTVPTTGAPGKATRWRLSGGADGGTKVSYLTDAWHTWRTLAGDGEFRSTGKPLRLVVAGDRVSYRGALQSMGPIKGHPDRITVNKVSLENYLRGVVAREMPASWHQAALRAQAIAARTYAAYKIGHPLSSRAAICETSRCQVYGGTAAETPSTDHAVAKTAHQVRLYDQKPAFTEFGSSNGGWLAEGSQPYLVAKHDPYDGIKDNPNHTWTVHVSAGAIEKQYAAIGNLRKIAVLERDGHGKWNGRIERMRLVGSTGSTTISGDTFRSDLGLRSTWLDFSVAS